LSALLLCLGMTSAVVFIGERIGGGKELE